MRPDPQRAGAIRSEALTHCGECGREFSRPVSIEQARADWGDAADDEIAYACADCAEDFERGEDHYGR